EGTDVHGDPPRQPLRLGEPRAAWPEDAGCVGLVYQEPAVIVLRQGDERREWCPIAVHGEDRIGHDEPPRALRGGGEQALEDRDVAVGIDVDGGSREPAAVDDARVVERVAVHVIAATYERRDGPDVRLIAGGEEERGRRALEGRELGLDLGVQVEVAGDQSRRAGAAAVARDRGRRRGAERGVGGEPEVVVGGEKEHPTTLAE